MNVLKQIASNTGVHLPAIIIPEGESLIPYGENRKRQLREEIYSLPSLPQAAQIIRDIRAEQQPHETVVQLRDVRMNPDNGGLYGPGLEAKNSLGYTPVAFNQAANVIKPTSVTLGFGQTLLALPAAIRAEAFNHFAGNQLEDKNVVLRTVQAAGCKGGELVLRRSVQASSRSGTWRLKTTACWTISSPHCPRARAAVTPRARAAPTSRSYGRR